MSSFLDASGAGSGEDQLSLLSVHSITATPDTLTKLVRRLRLMTLKLLPVEVEPADISSPTSRVITPQVISSYRAAAGDFTEALPYCLLRARQTFMYEANSNAADYGENVGRATACEVLARRIVHLAPSDRLNAFMSTRFRDLDTDGDESGMSSALELAIDTHCTIFLSSSEAQEVVNSLWTGQLVQQNNEHHDIDYVSYSEIRGTTFWDHLDPSRLSVPRYQNAFRITVWLIFLGVYSQAVRQPLDQLHDPQHVSDNWPLDEWEIVMYFIALSICLENIHKIWKLMRFATWRAFSFWNVVSFITDSLIISAFVLRMVGLNATGDRALTLRISSFQILSFVAPFIWMKIVTIFDGFKYVGMMQICIARMLQESGIFFALLSVLALGFTQALYALDAADGNAAPTYDVVNVLVQALLQSPDFSQFSASPTGLTMYYFWNVVTALILLNVLISLFSSAYSDVVDNAEAQYLAFFASKTVGMIRAPDSYVYPAPFNLIEIIFVSPFELAQLNSNAYAKLNRLVMRFVFFLPLMVIALYEAAANNPKNTWVPDWFVSHVEGDEDYPEIRNPQVETGEISKVPFEDLVSVFPNTAQSSEALILAEIQALRQEIEALSRQIKGSSTNGLKTEL